MKYNPLPHHTTFHNRSTPRPGWDVMPDDAELVALVFDIILNARTPSLVQGPRHLSLVAPMHASARDVFWPVLKEHSRPFWTAEPDEKALTVTVIGNFIHCVESGDVVLPSDIAQMAEA